MELKIHPYGKNDIMCNCNKCEDGKCRLAVSVEDNFAPCTFPKKFFDVEIRSRDGCFETFGKVAAGGSQVFDLPCTADGSAEYTVTVTGDMLSSPRSQTRRVCCCCGNTSGVTFIFMVYEPECEVVCPPCHPCPPPCPPPCSTCPPPCPPPCIELAPKPPVCPCEDFLL